MWTLPRVEEILRETGVPMSVKEIVELAGSSLPTRSKTPDTVVARDLSMDIKRNGEDSRYIRTSPGRYTLRALVQEKNEAQAMDLSSAIPSERAPALGKVRRTETESDISSSSVIR